MPFTRVVMLQLQLFVSKLTGPSIGFTALGIVTVTKEMILTVSAPFVLGSLKFVT